MNFIKQSIIQIKGHPTLSEKSVQEYIQSDTTVLGLGELTVRDFERRHQGKGRLDLLLQDSEELTRYVVELQLGSLDESHIIRAIEYWDLERKRFPQYEHICVIIAEDVTTRFLNVIQLFGESIPIVVIKMTAFQSGADIAITFTSILDKIVRGLIDEDEVVSVPTNRASWDSYSPKGMRLVDRLIQEVKKVDKRCELRYTKNYIGIEYSGSAFNFVSFVPDKSGSCHVEIKIDKNSETDDYFDKMPGESLKYDKKWRQYRKKISEENIDSFLQMVSPLFQKAFDQNS